MSWEYGVCGVVALLLGVYLVLALVRPERF